MRDHPPRPDDEFDWLDEQFPDWTVGGVFIVVLLVAGIILGVAIGVLATKAMGNVAHTMATVEAARGGGEW